MNGKTSANSHIEGQQLQEETNQKKTFVQDIFNINYVNTSKIYYQPTAHSSDVKVNNYLCYQEGQNLYKVTEIIYEDKLIRIQDKFEVNVDPDKIISAPIVTCTKKEKGQMKNIEKVRIFSKDSRKNGKIEKKDKKNIVKNIVKIFNSWLQKKQSEKQTQIWEVAVSQLKKLLELQNFNNRLIKSIVANDKINKAFLAFLTDDAEDQIKYSRIQDKESHYEAIELYASLLSQNKGRNKNFKFGSEEFSGSGSMEDGEFSDNDGGSLLDGSRQQSKSENNMMQSSSNHRRVQTRNSIQNQLNLVNISCHKNQQIRAHQHPSSNHSSNNASDSTNNNSKTNHQNHISLQKIGFENGKNQGEDGFQIMNQIVDGEDQIKNQNH